MDDPAANQEEQEAVLQLVYEPNPKHKPIPTPGRHGSICPPDADGPGLLSISDIDHRQRYATDGADAFCAQCHEYDEKRMAWVPHRMGRGATVNSVQVGY